MPDVGVLYARELVRLVCQDHDTLTQRRTELATDSGLYVFLVFVVLELGDSRTSRRVGGRRRAQSQHERRMERVELGAQARERRGGLG